MNTKICPFLITMLLAAVGFSATAMMTTPQINQSLLISTSKTMSDHNRILAAAPQQPAAHTSDDQAAVAALHREWILVGWEKKAGDGPLNFREKLGKYYSWSAPDVLLYDDFEPQRRVAHSATEYGSFWEPPFTKLRSAHHRVVDGPHVVVSGNLATSVLQFVARLEGSDGKITGIRTYTSLVWRQEKDGWKIIREHNSSTVLTPAELQKLMATAATH